MFKSTQQDDPLLNTVLCHVGQCGSPGMKEEEEEERDRTSKAEGKKTLISFCRILSGTCSSP